MTNRRRVWLLHSIGWTVWISISGAAGAQNLVVNGDFAADVAGWSTAYHGSVISIAWSSLDPADPSPSGSVEVTTTSMSGGSGGPTQCVDLAGGAIEIAMDAMVPAQPAFAYVVAAPYVRWYFGVGCTIGEISTEFVGGTAAAGAGWTQLTQALVPPVSAQAVLIDLGLYKPSGSSNPALAYFDNVYLPEPASGGLGAAALGALAIAARVRRRAGLSSRRGS